jgi:peptidoglycan biosynthesis protein MviN/MurJ (putative lipid II flippase)
VVVSVVLSYLLMQRMGPAGIACGASIAALYNTTMHLVHLQRRIGPVLRRPEWQAVGLVLFASAAAGVGGVGAGLLAGPHGALWALVASWSVYGGSYAALTWALHLPEAATLGRLVGLGRRP